MKPPKRIVPRIKGINFKFEGRQLESHKYFIRGLESEEFSGSIIESFGNPGANGLCEIIEWRVLRQILSDDAIGVLVSSLIVMGCLSAVRLLLGGRYAGVPTLSIRNANRHVSLALVLYGQHIHHQCPIRTIAT